MPQDEEPTAPRRSWPRRLLNRLEVDRAVFFAVCLRAWQSLAGIVTAVLVFIHFSGDVQGYYYTFAAVIALQTFFELGLNVVVINVCSHLWAKLKLDENGSIQGDAEDRSRLVSMGRLIFKWYGSACLLFIGVAGVAGWILFSDEAQTDVAWQNPWCALVILSGLLLWTLPFNALLEGCNQVATVNRFRLVQAICGHTTIWLVIVLQGNLWAAVAATLVRLLCDVYLLCVRYRNFFRPFFKPPAAGRVDWKSEIWPQQWRIALGGIFFYFAFYLFSPVMFHYHNAKTAGQMGMTWSMIMALQAAALAWVQTRVPRFGTLIVKKDFRELDRIFFRLTGISVCVFIGLGAAFWCAVFALNYFEHRWFDRMLAPLPTALFLAAVLLQHTLSCQDFYIRAHRREPHLLVLLTANIAVGVSVWILGSRYGPSGAAIGLLGVNLLYKFPLQTAVWLRCRHLWHKQQGQLE